ncbi:hypothetical protein DV515_00018792, partial [Chloebia gouldiae]
MSHEFLGLQLSSVLSPGIAAELGAVCTESPGMFHELPGLQLSSVLDARRALGSRCWMHGEPWDDSGTPGIAAELGSVWTESPGMCLELPGLQLSLVLSARRALGSLCCEQGELWDVPGAPGIPAELGVVSMDSPGFSLDLPGFLPSSGMSLELLGRLLISVLSLELLGLQLSSLCHVPGSPGNAAELNSVSLGRIGITESPGMPLDLPGSQGELWDVPRAPGIAAELGAGCTESPGMSLKFPGLLLSSVLRETAGMCLEHLGLLLSSVLCGRTLRIAAEPGALSTEDPGMFHELRGLLLSSVLEPWDLPGAPGIAAELGDVSMSIAGIVLCDVPRCSDHGDPWDVSGAPGIAAKLGAVSSESPGMSLIAVSTESPGTRCGQLGVPWDFGAVSMSIAEMSLELPGFLLSWELLVQRALGCPWSYRHGDPWDVLGAPGIAAELGAVFTESAGMSVELPGLLSPGMSHELRELWDIPGAPGIVVNSVLSGCCVDGEPWDVPTPPGIAAELGTVSRDSPGMSLDLPGLHLSSVLTANPGMSLELPGFLLSSVLRESSGMSPVLLGLQLSSVLMNIAGISLDLPEFLLSSMLSRCCLHGEPWDVPEAPWIADDLGAVSRENSGITENPVMSLELPGFKLSSHGEPWDVPGAPGIAAEGLVCPWSPWDIRCARYCEHGEPWDVPVKCWYRWPPGRVISGIRGGIFPKLQTAPSLPSKKMPKAWAHDLFFPRKLGSKCGHSPWRMVASWPCHFRISRCDFSNTTDRFPVLTISRFRGGISPTIQTSSTSDMPHLRAPILPSKKMPRAWAPDFFIPRKIGSKLAFWPRHFRFSDMCHLRAPILHSKKMHRAWVRDFFLPWRLGSKCGHSPWRTVASCPRHFRFSRAPIRPSKKMPRARARVFFFPWKMGSKCAHSPWRTVASWHRHFRIRGGISPKLQTSATSDLRHLGASILPSKKMPGARE